VRRSEIAQGELSALRAMSFGSSTEFLGASPAAKQLAARIPRVAASDVNALIEGETGVGKTFVARLIHELGSRAAEPLRVINCAAIPESLVEGELFGHERGAFTGAVARRVGALEAAGRGTLFLDEVGELSLPSQAKLLRAIEEKRFERLGSNEPLELKARVLCATNRDLEAMASDGRFRKDLLFRVSVVRLTIPPLRDRGDDLPLLAHQILSDLARGAHRRIAGFSADALQAIKRYAWPGNVRELKNAIEHAIVMGEGSVIEVSDFPEAIAGSAGPASPASDTVTLPLPLAALEARDIEAALRVARNNRKRAAAILGIPRSTLYTKLATVAPPAPPDDD
jgi:two-component system response regulator HydG